MALPTARPRYANRDGSFLIEALRTSGIFPAAQLGVILRELRALDDDAHALMRHMLHREWLSLYQLRKVLHGKAHELHLGPYLLTDKIGEGGMGKVYRARRATDGMPVALKIVRPILLATDYPQALPARSRRRTASKHPNLSRCSTPAGSMATFRR